MITVGRSQQGKRDAGDMGDPNNFPKTKRYNKHYGEKTAAGLFVIVAAIPLVNTVIDFFWSSKKRDRK